MAIIPQSKDRVPEHHSGEENACGKEMEGRHHPLRSWAREEVQGGASIECLLWEKRFVQWSHLILTATRELCAVLFTGNGGLPKVTE